MPNCKNCKYWDTKLAEPQGFGYCLLFDRKLTETENNRREDMAFISAGNYDGGSDYESLVTNENFGCVLFTNKDTQKHILVTDDQKIRDVTKAIETAGADDYIKSLKHCGWVNDVKSVELYQLTAKIK